LIHPLIIAKEKILSLFYGERDHSDLHGLPLAVSRESELVMGNYLEGYCKMVWNANQRRRLLAKNSHRPKP